MALLCKYMKFYQMVKQIFIDLHKFICYSLLAKLPVKIKRYKY